MCCGDVVAQGGLRGVVVVTGYGTAKGFRQGDEYDRAEIDDHLLDLADDHDLRGTEWDVLHGNEPEHPTMAEAIAENGRARKQASVDPGHDRWWASRG